ncbi:MAG: L-arabinose isomerase family protein [Planctomycetota bacterium]|jgi:L-arabinose isomerase
MSEKFKIGLLAGVAELYNRLWTAENHRDLQQLVDEVSEHLSDDRLEVIKSDIVSTAEQVDNACRKFDAEQVDLLVVALAPYCPSGVIAPALLRGKTPVVLWPMQSMPELVPEQYDRATINLNHGVHAVQDLANVLGKKSEPFGLIHGHWQQEGFLDEFKSWTQAGRAICAMQRSNPVQIGGHFEDMLDLQIGEEAFVKEMSIEAKIVSCDELCQLLADADKQEVTQCLGRYREIFDIAKDVDEELLGKAARGEVAVRSVMLREKSSACGLNFLELCNDQRIADGFHVAASMFMKDGFGYAGEGDWVTASFVYALQQGFGEASFTEIFSVGYADNRLMLKHWGEGNFGMARAKPKLIHSKFTDKNTAEFVAVDFEFEVGDVTLVNLNSTDDGRGQLISITGCITEDNLPKATGPRAVFKPTANDVRDVLNEYAYAGGSHHSGLVKGHNRTVIEKISRLAGWKCIEL